MSIEYLFQQLINALSVGSTIALLALGLAIIFNIMRMINFAHGELLTIGGFTMFVLSQNGFGWSVMLPAAILVPAFAAILMERVAFRPIRSATLTTTMITSFAVAIVVQHLLVIQFGSRQKVVPFPRWVTQNVSLGAFDIQILQIAATLVTGLALLGLTLFLRRSQLGISMRAAADDFEVTRLLGIRADRVIATAFALSGALAGLASLFWVARRGTVGPMMGLTPLVNAFIAAVIGGLGSLPGAVVGGFVLGFIRVALETLLPSGPLRFIDAFTISLVVLVLLLRPQGLFGAAQVERA